jgi:DNA-binding XRE family transcriptional regulator
MNAKAQIIVTPSGERLALLPEADFIALVDAAEEAADIATLREFRTALATGEEELLHAAMVDRILAGEPPLRVWREHRGLTSRALAEAAGLAQAYVSQIETGRRAGSIETWSRLAGVLGVRLDDLLPLREDAPPSTVRSP